MLDTEMTMININKNVIKGIDQSSILAKEVKDLKNQLHTVMKATLDL